MPLGQAPEDLAREAIRRTLDGQRKWKPRKNPDLCGYLMDVIDSLMSGLLEKTAYRHRDGKPLEEHFDVPSPEDPSQSDECFEALKEICDEACADEEDLENVRQGLEDHMKSAEIADFFGIEVKDVYRLTRKLKRRIERAMAEHPCSEHWQQIRN